MFFVLCLSFIHFFNFWKALNDLTCYSRNPAWGYPSIRPFLCNHLPTSSEFLSTYCRNISVDKNNKKKFKMPRLIHCLWRRLSNLNLQIVVDLLDCGHILFILASISFLQLRKENSWTKSQNFATLYMIQFSHGTILAFPKHKLRFGYL